MFLKKKNVLAVSLAMVMLLGACGTTADKATPPPTDAPAPVATDAAATDAAPATEAPATQAPVSGEKVLRINNHEEPGSLHPALAEGTHDSWILDHMFEGLYNKTPDGVENALCESSTVSEDGLTWTYKIRQDGKWSNGDPVVAEDFISSWKWCLNPEAASQYASMLYIFKGGEAYNSSTETDPAKLKELEDAVGVKALDEYTIEIQLNYAMPYLPDYITHYTFYPANHKLQAENPHWAEEAATYVSNGPFVLTDWQHKVSMTCVKNTNYRLSDQVKIDKIEWAMDPDQGTEWQKYQAGELDLAFPLLPQVIEQQRNANDPELQILPDLSTYYYLFNNSKKPFNNIKVRQALSMSVNREALVKNITKGGQTPAFGIVCPGINDDTGEYNKNLGPLFTEDPVKGKQLLAEGLQEEGMDIANFSFTILYNTNDTHKKVAEAVQNMWKQSLGIDVKLENAEFQVVLDKRHNGDYEVCRAGWIGDYADPMTFLDMFMSNNLLNDSHWANEEYDNLIKTAMNSTDAKVRMDAMKAAEKLMIGDQQVIMPLYFYTKPLTLRPYVQGMFCPVNRYPDFTMADIVK